MRDHSKTSFVIAMLVCVSLFLPLLGMLFPNLDSSSKLNEMRQLATRPSFNIIQADHFPQQFETYFNDHFGYRNTLIYLNSKLNHRLFRQSSSEKVLIGKEKWLFYTQDNIVNDYRGINAFSKAELEQWKNILEQRQKWLAEQGIAYLFVVAPNKTSIYPEHLPNSIQKVREQTPLDQLTTYLHKNSAVNFYDLRPALIEKKEIGKLYHMTDTHWNQRGAFIAYNAIIHQLHSFFPQMKALRLDELNISTQNNFSGDLATILGLQDIYSENIPLYYPHNVNAQEKHGMMPLEFNTSSFFIMETKNEKAPRALMFRDSFTLPLVPFLSENFSSIEFLCQRWDGNTAICDLIERQQPDVIIEEVVERYLNQMGLLINTFENQRQAGSAKSTKDFNDKHKSPMPKFIPVNQVSITLEGGIVRVVSQGNDPHFILSLPVKKGEELILNTEMTSPEPSIFQVFYQTEDMPVYNEKNSLSVVTNKGKNKISISIPEKKLIGRIRIDPGRTSGDYVFHTMEIKTNQL